MLDSFKLSDLKTMNKYELTKLAEEVREHIIKVTSKNGGHLASNLGVVELTIAMHKVFDSPFDKIIFDVSHQSYTHKILTGRYNEFKTLRTYNGISGFTKMDESVHDVFEGGHSSTSISAGLGFLEAKKTKPNEIGEVIAVIGDASITNGLCFEALNYLAANTNQKMIIIINDNNMSISENIGFLAKRYNSLRVKKSMKAIKKIVPLRIKHALQYYAYKVDLFTSLGFKYFENINGHDFDELNKYLTAAKNSTRSVVLHVKTIKGKGFDPAEADKIGMWHGVSAYNISSGEFKESFNNLTFGEALSDELINICDKEYKDLIRVLCPAMGLGSGLLKFQEKHPDKFIDVGIAEENGAVMASSMALMGLIPVYFVYATFLQRAYDELMHDIARTNTHVVFCVDHAGLVSSDGDTHQGIYDLAMYSSIPGLTVLNPTSIIDVKNMLNYALFELDGPVVIRYPKGEISSNLNVFSKDLKWNVIKPGKDYIVSYTPCLNEVLTSNEINNLNVGIVGASVLNKIDEEFINNLKSGSTLYIYEDVIYPGSLASIILKYVNDHNLNIKVKSLCIDNTYIKCGNINQLKEEYKISINDLINLININNK